MLALRLVTYLLVCDGIAALYLAGLIGPLGAAFVVLAMLASWWLERARERGVVRPAVAWGLVGAAAVAIATDLVYLASTALDGMVHVLLFLILARLFIRHGLRDLRDAGFLSFFLLVATSTATFSMGFLAVFVSFLLLGTWMLMLHHIAAETERAPRAAGAAPVTRLVLRGPLTRMSLMAAATAFAVSAMLFFVIPRVGQATLPLRTQVGRMVTGFSNHVELGAFGDIEADKTVVMRVYLTDETLEPMLLPGLRWRGIVFDRFDGRTWAVGRASRALVRRSPDGRFHLGAASGPGFVVRQDIYLEPIGADVVFAAPRALRVDLPNTGLALDDMGSLSAPNASAGLHYRVESELELPQRAVSGRSVVPLSEAAQRRFLQLPAMSPSIARLARQVTAGSAGPYEAALALDRFLSSRFRYTPAKPQTALDPLEEFLFIRRSGNCEYFAAALAVMLRSLGIPARVIGGFQQGDWNPYGRYFMVRLSDAHAWVEAYFGDRGWVTLDPSPRSAGAVDAGPSAMALYLDAARMRWYRYVVNWSLQDQRVIASTVHRQARDVSLAFTWPALWRGKLWLAIAAVAGAGGALGWLVWRAGRGRPVPLAGGGPPRFYERALRALARLGLSPDPAETARQFSSRTRHEVPACGEPLARITAVYERVRFGAAAPTDDEMRDVERCLAALEHR
jgi:hypothetical protein